MLWHIVGLLFKQAPSCDLPEGAPQETVFHDGIVWSRCAPLTPREERNIYSRRTRTYFRTVPNFYSLGSRNPRARRFRGQEFTNSPLQAKQTYILMVLSQTFYHLYSLGGRLFLFFLLFTRFMIFLYLTKLILISTVVL
jgi:hypothetical protein